VAASSWARWRPEIAKACDGSHHTIEGIEASLASGQFHYLELDDDAGCYVVEIQPYPQEIALQIWWAAGTLEALVAGLPDVHEWARQRGCTEVLIEGHAGWARALRHLDYAVWSITLRRPL
jgi:hypothetical protein